MRKGTLVLCLLLVSSSMISGLEIPSSFAQNIQCDLIVDKADNSSWLGEQETECKPTPDNSGFYMWFDNGAVYLRTETNVPVALSKGPIAEAWGRWNWEQGELGYPVKDQFSTPTKKGQGLDLEGGSIHWKAGSSNAYVTLRGPIWDKWAEQKWEQGELGFPTRDWARTLHDDGDWEAFEGGVIYKKDGKGAFIVWEGPILQQWSAMERELGKVGYPVADEVTFPDTDARYQQFENGYVYYTPDKGSYFSASKEEDFPPDEEPTPPQSIIQCEMISEKADENSWLGHKVSDCSQTPDNSGYYMWFDNGAVFLKTKTNVPYSISRGPIADAWDRWDWEQGELGYPVKDQFSTPTKKGQGLDLEGGSIHWKAGSSNAYVTLRGPIWDKWAEQKWEQGELGFPTRDWSRTLKNDGSWESFDGGFIYARDGKEGVIIRNGPIHDKWKEFQWEYGKLGYPVADQVTFPGTSAKYQQFEVGYIYYTEEKGAFFSGVKISDFPAAVKNPDIQTNTGPPKWSEWKSIPLVNLPSETESVFWKPALNADGRAEIFVESNDGDILHSWEIERNGEWSEWFNLGNPGNVGRDWAIAANQDGSLNLFYFVKDQSQNHNHLYYIRQTKPNGDWSGWRDLGILPYRDGRATYETGFQVLLDKDGRLNLFATVLNEGRGVTAEIYSIRQTQPNGEWSSWSSLIKMPHLMDSVKVAKNADGRFEIFGSYTTSSPSIPEIFHSWQNSEGKWTGEWIKMGVPVISESPDDNFYWIDPLSNEDGRLELIIGYGRTHEIFHRWQEVPNGEWYPEWIKLGEYGSVLADKQSGSLKDGRLFYAEYSLDGSLYYFNQQVKNGEWSETSKSIGGPVDNAPATSTRGVTDLQYLKGADRSVFFARSAFYEGDREYLPLFPIWYSEEATLAKPKANAGNDQTVRPGATVTLDGTQSQDGGKPSSPLSYKWVQTEGPTVTLQNRNTARPSFVAASQTLLSTFVFQLTVNNGIFDSEPDFVKITAKPLLNAQPVPESFVDLPKVVIDFVDNQVIVKNTVTGEKLENYVAIQTTPDNFAEKELGISGQSVSTIAFQDRYGREDSNNNLNVFLQISHSSDTVTSIRGIQLGGDKISIQIAATDQSLDLANSGEIDLKAALSSHSPVTLPPKTREILNIDVEPSEVPRVVTNLLSTNLDVVNTSTGDHLLHYVVLQSVPDLYAEKVLRIPGQYVTTIAFQDRYGRDESNDNLNVFLQISHTMDRITSMRGIQLGGDSIELYINGQSQGKLPNSSEIPTH